jgi:hypothetical protein
MSIYKENSLRRNIFYSSLNIRYRAYCQVLFIVTAVSQLSGTVKDRFGSLSQSIVPELPTLINLY